MIRYHQWIPLYYSILKSNQLNMSTNQTIMIAVNVSMILQISLRMYVYVCMYVRTCMCVHVCMCIKLSVTTALGEIPASNRFETTLCSEVMIRCSVQLQDQLIPVTWAKDGQVLSSDGRKELSGTRGEQLKIKYVLSSDEGIYTCEPATATGARTSASIYMRVRGK